VFCRQGKTAIPTIKPGSSLIVIPSNRQRFVIACVFAVLCNAFMTSHANAQTQPPASTINLPSLGDTASDEFGVSPERKLGEQIMREIRRDPDYLDDPLLLAYVQAIWTPLVHQARVQGELGPEIDERFSFELFLVRDRSVNAFALPGGYAGVHTGLIGLTSSRDELAAVLAHELTHITQRHIARGIANSKKQNMIALASMIVGVLAASRDGGAAANAAIVGGQAVAVQGQLNFSRDMEREADRIGYSVLGGAGFAPGGMAAMFEKLAQSSRLNDNGAFPYLRSHPLTSERLGEARSRLAGAASAVPLNYEHSVAQAYARVLGDSRVDTLRRWQSQQSETCEPSPSSTNAEAVQETWLACVQSALASKALRDWRRFDAAWAQAAKKLPSTAAQAAATRQWFDLLQAQSLVERGDLAQAALVLNRAQDNRNASGRVLSHLDRPLLLQRAEVAAASAATPPEARQIQIDALQSWLSTHAKDARAWSALSALWAAQGQRLRAVRADAESHHARGDLTGAMDRLRSGQALVRAGQVQDFIESSVIDARMRDFEALQKRLLLEQRGL
jgi:predicted Zn-dependent protease